MWTSRLPPLLVSLHLLFLHLFYVVGCMGHGKMQKVEKGMDKAVAKMDEVEAKTKKAVR